MMVWDQGDLPTHFLLHIYWATEKPDIVVWSDEGKEAILLELTVGDGVASAIKLSAQRSTLRRRALSYTAQQWV